MELLSTTLEWDSPMGVQSSRYVNICKKKKNENKIEKPSELLTVLKTRTKYILKFFEIIQGTAYHKLQALKVRS